METNPLKFWKFFALLVVVLNIGLLALTFFKPNDKPHPQHGGPAKFIIEELKFTKEQEATFNTLKRAHHSSIMQLQKQGDSLREQFFNGLKSDTLVQSNDSILALIQENQKQIELVTYNHFAQVKALCDPKQKEIFNSIINDILHQLKPQGGPTPHGRP